jgi:hypothetical protein
MTQISVEGTFPVPAARAVTGGLLPGPATATSSQRPFWHRADPLVAVTRIDPGHALLRHHFPGSWQSLVRLKALIDAISSLDVPAATPRDMYQRRIAPLLTAAAQELATFALSDDSLQGGAARAHARFAADRFQAFSRTGEWRPIVLRPPEPEAPWLYCGPLNTWAMRTARTPLSFLLAVPRPDLQPEPDLIDASVGAVQAAIGAAAGGTPWSIQGIRPAMHITDLLLAGGDSPVGHKHFAHFFPLESPCSSVDGPEFTVVFSNIHASRLRLCSTELLRRYAPGQYRPDEEVLRASLAWFRGHDLAHFWRLTPDAAEQSSPDSPLTAFERMTLEETYADVLGLVSAASLGQHAALGEAFAAELLRYLSRESSYFADSSAAALAIGWLRMNGVTQDVGTAAWLDAALPVIGPLGQIIHGTLWQDRDDELAALREAFQAGREFGASLGGLYASVPTDLEYVFG